MIVFTVRSVIHFRRYGNAIFSWTVIGVGASSRVSTETASSGAVVRARSAGLLPLVVLACAQLGTSADNGAFSVAMSEMMRVFGCSLADVQMASTVYSLMAGTFMLASGLLGMVVGWVRNFRAGLVLACIGELICVFAPNIELLIWAGRLSVGLGASLIIPSVLGMVSLLYEGEKRKQAYGVIAASAALATIVPIPLGMLVDAYGFRVTFGVLAVYFILLLVGSAALPRGGGVRLTKFDVPGALVASLGLFAVMCGLSRISVWGVLDPLPQTPFTVCGISPALPIVAVGLVLLAVLIPLERWSERERGVAILPSSFVRNASVRSGVVAIALPFFYMGAQGLVATSFYQLVIGLGGAQTALLGIISGVPMLVLAMFVPRKFPQLKPWNVVRVGYVGIAFACACMAMGVRAEALTPVMVVGTLFGGAGVGLVNSQANNIVASAVPARDAQQSGGIQGAARNLGLALGSAAMGSVLLVAMNSGLDARIVSSKTIDTETKTLLEDIVYTFESDAAFAAHIEAMGVSGAATDELAQGNAEVRADAASMAFGTVAGLATLALFTTRPRIAEVDKDAEDPSGQ